MRSILITVQAAILTCLAVLGANSETGTKHSCPLPQAQLAQHCD